MDVITIESEAFKKLIESVNELKAIVSENFKNQSPGSQGQKTWLNKKEACQMLRISERTLQTYRNTGVIPFQGYKVKFTTKLKTCKHSLTTIIKKVKADE